jgi:hypothetical protein
MRVYSDSERPAAVDSSATDKALLEGWLARLIVVRRPRSAIKGLKEPPSIFTADDPLRTALGMRHKPEYVATRVAYAGDGRN